MLRFSFLLHPAQPALTTLWLPAGGISASILEIVKIKPLALAIGNISSCSVDYICSLCPFSRRTASIRRNCGCGSTQRVYLDRVQGLYGISCFHTSPSTPFWKCSDVFPDLQQPVCLTATPNFRASWHGPVSRSSASIPSLHMGQRTDLHELGTSPRLSGSVYDLVLKDMEQLQKQMLLLF